MTFDPSNAMTHQSKTVSTSSLLQEHRIFPPSLEVVKRAWLNADQYQAMYERSVNAPDAFTERSYIAWY